MPDGGNVHVKGQDTKETDLIELRRDAPDVWEQ